MAKKVQTLQTSLKGPSMGKNAISMGFQFARDDMTLEDAASLFVGARLKVKMHPAGDVDGQRTFDGKGTALEVTADLSTLKVSPDNYGGSLKIHPDDVSIDRLGEFAFHDTKVRFERTGDAKPAEKDEDDDEGRLPMDGDKPE